MIDVTSKRKNKSTLKIDILKCFGADFQEGVKSPLKFAGENGNSIIYPVGHHIAIRDIFAREELKRNDIMFIYNDEDVIKITALDTTKDYSLLLVCEQKPTASVISIYNLSKLNFKNLMQFKPKRRVISTIYSEFIYSSFSIDGNYIASIGKVRGSEDIHGIIWDVQIFQPYKPDNYKPKCVFPLPNSVNKITIENKILCTSGYQHLSFWYIYENSVKEFKTGIKNLNVNNCNFVDHDWLNVKIPTVAAITEQRELYLFEGYSSSKNSGANFMRKDDLDEDDDSNYSLRIEKFVIKQHINEIFTDETIIPNILKSFNNGIVIGSTQGHLLFVQKFITGDNISFSPIRYTKREKQACVTGLTVNKAQDYFAVSYDSNEIAYFNIKNIFENLRVLDFELKMDLVCEGFHQGAITTMDVALQRPIIITTSGKDKTVRAWNFITGHCEYCKVILTEKEKNKEKEMEILAVAIHPNGYYIAISDKEMIRFFHLCYKELRFYNNDSTASENSHPECHLLKFSHGGHLLAAVSGKQMFILRSYTRETIKTFDTPHNTKIEKIFFHEQDHFIYTIGSDGMICEYNLFNFHFDKLCKTDINFFCGCFSLLNKNQNCIIAVGEENDSNIINEILCTEIEYANTNQTDEKNDDREKGREASSLNLSNTDIDGNANPNLLSQNQSQRKVDKYISKVNESLTSICSFKSKKLDVGSYATGSDNGYMSLYPNLLFLETKGKTNHKSLIPWNSIKSHRGKITHIEFNHDSNLIFSAGEDGNLFIYNVTEIQEGENLDRDDNYAMERNQMGNVFEEGLGDNVLYPLEKIFLRENDILEQNNLIDKYKNQEEQLKQEHKMRLRETELEHNKKREIETNELNERLTEERLAKQGIVDHYNKQIENLERQQKQILIDKENQYKERIDQMSNTIHDLNSKIYSLKSEHEVDLKKKDEGYEKKFKEINEELKNKLKEIQNNNDKLSSELKLRTQLEEYKFIHLDQEHEQEINYKNEKFESLIAKMEEERLANHAKIAELKKEKQKKINELNSHESELKKKNEEIKRHIDTIKTLKEANEMKEMEKKDLENKLKESEESLQEKSKLAGFSSKLKNELYVKNVEIMSKFNKQKHENAELKKISKNTEKQLDDNIRLLNDKKEEVNKRELQLEEYINKYEKEKNNVKKLEKDMDNLLQKIYDTFQTGDKNIIIKEIRKIYNMYLSNDQEKKIDSSKLNINIRDELTKQIDFLQKGILNIADQKAKRENNQNSEIFKKTRENSALTIQLNQKEKDYTELNRQLTIVKRQKAELDVKYNQLVKEFNNLQNINKKMNYNLSASNRTQTGGLGERQNFMSKTAKFGFGLKMQQNGMPIQERKSWKDTKIYKGSTLSNFKESLADIYKKNEIQKILDDKDEVIKRQKLEITLLKNKIAQREKEIVKQNN